MTAKKVLSFDNRLMELEMGAMELESMVHGNTRKYVTSMAEPVFLKHCVIYPSLRKIRHCSRLNQPR